MMYIILRDVLLTYMFAIFQHYAELGLQWKTTFKLYNNA